MKHFMQLRRDPASRRQFLRRMTAAGLGAAAFSLLAKSDVAQAKRHHGVRRGIEGSAAAAFPGIPGSSNDEIVLNFALTLEILEADLYRQALNAATGRALSTPLQSNQSAYKLAITSGFDCDPETQAGFVYLKQFAYVEVAHRDFVRAAIEAAGGTPVSPNPGGYKFPGGLPGNLQGILQQIIPLEETGVRAYLGAAPYLTDLPTIQTASTIYSTEARHSAVINLVLEKPVGPTKMPGDLEAVPNPPAENTFEKFLAPATVIQRVGVYFG